MRTHYRINIFPVDIPFNKELSYLDISINFSLSSLNSIRNEVAVRFQGQN